MNENETREDFLKSLDESFHRLMAGKYGGQPVVEESANDNAELDRNTAEAVYGAMMVDDYSRLAEQETVRRANQMRETERLKLVAHLLERIETINSELDANVTTHSYERNRALYLIEQMRLGRGFGDVADQSGGVDIAAAYNYVARISKADTAEIETEEELARRGL